MSRRVSFGPDDSKHGGNKKRVVAKLWTSNNLPSGTKFSPAKILRQIGEEVATALGFVSSRRKRSGKVSSATSVTRCRSYAEDSQRAEAIEDCIEFLNSSSSLQRSNSVSSSC